MIYSLRKALVIPAGSRFDRARHHHAEGGCLILGATSAEGKEPVLMVSFAIPLSDAIARGLIETVAEEVA